jgi:hypothetical protein
MRATDFRFSREEVAGGNQPRHDPMLALADRCSLASCALSLGSTA